MNTTGRFLLTGAGFTHNFGGPLAAEMWGLILSSPSVRRLSPLRERLLKEFDFEEVYYRVMAEGTDDEQEALNDAVFAAYRLIDEKAKAFRFSRESPFPVGHQVLELIAAFGGANSQPGFVFTLNHDLFLERHYHIDPRPDQPGINGPPGRFDSNFNYTLDHNSLIRIPNEEEMDKLRVAGVSSYEFHYLKLHGSCNWRSASRPQQMVLGRSKEQQIQTEPLLAWYFDLFRDSLSSPQARLLIIGYGFADPHVNGVLASCIKNNGLQLFLLCPDSPKDLQRGLLSKDRGAELWQGVAGYYQTTLARLFPSNQEETPEWKGIIADFFKEKP